MSEHKPMPVAGYTAQKQAAIDAVNLMKREEERVLTALDVLAGMPDIAPDGRWFAIGRTAIEQGFMAINRSIFKPERLRQPDAADRAGPEFAWLIEFADSPVSAPDYFAAGKDGPIRTPHVSQALRFARREDAEAFALKSWGTLRGVRVREHGWG